jgi:hypothetical protein
MAVPKSSLYKALTYARNQWQALRRYTEDGRLTMDNNVSERTLRQQAIGRKNWLFLGSEAAGPRAAVLYTIIAGAKRHRIEPWAYVRDLLLRLHADDLRLEEMLPTVGPQPIQTPSWPIASKSQGTERSALGVAEPIAEHAPNNCSWESFPSTIESYGQLFTYCSWSSASSGNSLTDTATRVPRAIASKYGLMIRC